MLRDSIEEGVVITVSKHARSHGLDRIGTCLRSLFDRGGIVLVLVPDFIHIFSEISEQETLFLAGLFSDLD